MRDLDASIILPCYNRARLLPLSLASLRNQSFYEKDYEVLVVDDGSTDNTASVVRSSQWTQCRYLRKLNGGAASARNYGLKYARGRVIIYSDPDMVVCPDFVRNHVRHHADGTSNVVIGGKREVLAHLPWWMPGRPGIALLRQLHASAPHVCRKVISWMFSWNKTRRVLRERHLRHAFHLVDDYSLPFPIPEPPMLLHTLAIPWVFLLSGNFSAPAETLQQTGGFDETFCGWGLEDVELGYRLHKHGVRFIYEPAALSYHQVHGVATRRNEASIVNNLRHFTTKHPCREVELHGDYIRGKMTLEEYDRIVREHRAIS